MSATLDDFRWLVSDAAQPWLTRVRDELFENPRSVTPAFLQRLRKDLSAERAHLIVEQIDLRQRAREKFSLADSMYFTKKGLEQATDEVLANYKAAKFSGDYCIGDLCCGIGGDLLALGKRYRNVGGVDRDQVVVTLANANIEAQGIEERCSVIAAVLVDIMKDVNVSNDCRFAWHCDPDRRPDEARTTQLDHCNPATETLDDWRKSNPNAAIKLAPATEVPIDWSPIAELEWLGSRGECRQQVAWFGSLARHPGKHAATVVAEDGAARTIVGEPSEPIEVAADLGRYVYEPQAAVLAAHLVGAVCREHGLAAVSANIPYLTGDRLLADDALAGFEIREVLPFDRKQLRGWCREHSIGVLEIKKRGLPVDPAQLRTEIIAKGDNAATIIVTPTAVHARVLIVERLENSKEPHPSPLPMEEGAGNNER